MSEFNTYHKWLGIPPEEQPPNHYRLLGITLFEKDRAVIIAALDQRQLFLQKKSVGPQGNLAEPLLEQLQQARLCLLNRLTKAQYDSQLRQRGVSAASVRGPGEPSEVRSPIASAANSMSEAAPLTEPADVFQFPGEAELKDDSAISKGMAWRSRKVAWSINLLVICCLGGGAWWLMNRGMLPPPGELLKSGNDHREVEDSDAPDVNDEPEPLRKPTREAIVATETKPPVQPPAKLEPQEELPESPPKSPAVVRRPSKSLRPATEMARFSGHRIAVADFALSADGGLLATAGSSGDCRVWDVATGETTARFTGHNGHVHAVALSSDGTQALSSAETLKLWNAKTGAELVELKTNRRPSRAILFWPGKPQAVTAGAGAIEIWDLKTRKQLRMISGVHPFCGSLALTDDSKTLAAVTGDQAEVATLFQASNGKTIRSFVGPKVRISSIAISKDGSSIWVASGEHTALRWDTKAGTTEAVFAHADVLTLSPDETLLATGGLNGLVSIWNANTGSGLLQLPRLKLRILDIAFLPDAEHLLVAGESTDTDNQTATIQLWSIPKLDPNAPGSRPNSISVAGSTLDGPPSSTEPDTAMAKLPLPAEEQQEESKKTIREIFKQDFAKAIRLPEKAKLAEKLFEQARTSTDDPAGRFVLLQEANELASASGDFDVATKVLDELTKTFAVDALKVRSTTLRKLSTTVKSGTAQEGLAEAFLKLAEDYAAESQYDSAIEATKAATVLAIKAKNLKLRDTVKNRADEYLLKKKSLDKT
jgi:WD40 repeat protein